jgi:hypothetical protein
MTEISDEIIRAAQKHDWDNQPNQNWQRVPDAQVRRLIEGAVAVERERAAKAIDEAVYAAALGKFGETVNRITDATVGAKLAEVEAAVRADERRRIRELAVRSRAVCTGDEGTSHYFSALLEDKPTVTP